MKASVFSTLKNTVKWTGLVLVLICLALITWLSLKSGLQAPINFENVDKVEHFIAYAGFSFSLTLMTLGFSKRFSEDATIKKLLPCGILPVLLALFYGVLIEFLQPKFGRSFDVLDMVADFTGALFGCFICFLCVVLLRKVLLKVETEPNRQ